MNKLLEKFGIERSQKIDRFVFDSLKKQAPFAYWIFSKKIFQNKWIGKLFQLELIWHQKDIMNGKYILEVLIRKKVIGKIEL